MIRLARQSGEVGDGQDRGRGQLPAGAGAATARGAHGARAGDQPVVVADQLLKVGEELLLGRAAAVHAHVRGAPELAHPGLSPHLRALGPRLQQGEQRDPARPVVAVQVGQLPPAADVRRLIQHPDQRGRQPAAG